jgi:hypothetical protein
MTYLHHYCNFAAGFLSIIHLKNDYQKTNNIF